MPAPDTHPTRTVVFAGGGTGGHLFPALAVAGELARVRPDIRAVFLCSTRPLDAAILSGARVAGKPVEFRPIAARPLGLGPGTLLRFIGGWGGAVRSSRQAIRACGAGVTVAAFGGFVAAPVVQAARAEGRPVVLVNLDAVPGKANRWISRHAREVLTSAPVASRPSWRRVPPIVRAEALSPGPAGDCRRSFGLDPGARTLLVTGGSQGAGSINGLVRAVLEKQGWLAGWQVIHQCGANAEAELRGAYERAGVPARVEPFIREMGAAWGAADLALCRAGASSVAEAWANRVPAVFLPYPHHRDQHQKANAMPVVEAGAGVLGEDLIDAGATLERLGPVLHDLLTGGEALGRMRGALDRLGPADGALQTAQVLAG